MIPFKNGFRSKKVNEYIRSCITNNRVQFKYYNLSLSPALCKITSKEGIFLLRKNRIGQSSLFVSEIGLGCMSLGTDEKKAVDIVKKAIDIGINYLDTADLYDFGLNEAIVGNAIRENRDNVILATKVGNRFEEGKSGWDWDPSKSYIKSAVKKSLHRMQTDYIDLYQLHGGTLEDNLEETIEAFDELVDEGVIRYYGISSIRPNVIKEYVQKSNIVSVMMQYSILDRRPEEQILDLLYDHHISVIARGPLAKGLLTDKFTEKINGSTYLDYTTDDLTTFLPKLKNHFENKSLNNVSLRYSLHHPAVAAVIPGASSMNQLLENVEQVLAGPLTDEEYLWIQSNSKENVYSSHRD